MTKANIRRAADWFKGVMGIEDWTFDIVLTDEPPDWVQDRSPSLCGYFDIRPTRKLAKIWVSQARTATQFPGQTALDSLFHEQCHAAFEDCGLRTHQTNNPRTEFLADRIAALAVKQYNHEKKRRKPRRA